MKVAAMTHKGVVRENNEDFYGYDEIGNKFFVVADGMGGHNAGEVASKIAVEEVVKFLSTNDIEFSNVKGELSRAVNLANRKIFHLAQENDAYEGMGTTLTAAYIQDECIYFAHVGDSRAYVLKDSGLNQVTSDHTLVSALIKSGTITEEQAINHPKKNIITKALGTDADVACDVESISLDGVRAILLCSDGLTNLVSDSEIEGLLNKNENVTQQCEELVRLSNARGGYDNITVLIVKTDLFDNEVKVNG